MTDFSERYGPWAVVAGGSDGIGASFALALEDDSHSDVHDRLLLGCVPEERAALPVPFEPDRGEGQIYDFAVLPCRTPRPGAKENAPPPLGGQHDALGL